MKVKSLLGLLLVGLVSTSGWAAQDFRAPYKLIVFNHKGRFGEVNKAGESCFGLQYSNFKSWKLMFWYRARLILPPLAADLPAGKRDYWAQLPNSRIAVPESLSRYDVRLKEVPLSSKAEDTFSLCVKPDSAKDMVRFAKFVDPYMLKVPNIFSALERFKNRNQSVIEKTLMQNPELRGFTTADLDTARSLFLGYLSFDSETQKNRRFTLYPFSLTAFLPEPISRPTLIAVEHRSKDKRKKTQAALNKLVNSAKISNEHVVFLLSDPDIYSDWLGETRSPDTAFFSVRGEHNLMIKSSDITFTGGSANVELGLAIRDAITRHFLVTNRKLRLHLPLQAIYTTTESFKGTQIEPQDGTLYEVLQSSGDIEDLIALSGVRETRAGLTSEPFDLRSFEVSFFLDKKPHFVRYGAGSKKVEVYFWRSNSWDMIEPYETTALPQ
jgi:hypothetical protein